MYSNEIMATESLKMYFWESTLSKVFEWYKAFRKGCEVIEKCVTRVHHLIPKC